MNLYFAPVVSCLLIGQLVANDHEVNRAAIVATANKASQRLSAGEGVAWETRIVGPSATLVVYAWAHADGWRRDLCISIEGEEIVFASIIERNGWWYVFDGKLGAIYRPYQAPIAVNGAYTMVRQSQLVFANQPDLPTRAESLEDGSVKLRVPLSDASRSIVERRIKSLYDDIDTDTASAGDVSKALSILRSYLEKGVPTVVDQKNGIVIRRLSLGDFRPIEISSFEWIGDDAKMFLDVSDHDWIDRTADLTRDNGNQLALCLRVGNWATDADRNATMSFVLFDLEKAEYRRVPLAVSDTIDGRFLPGRKEVVVPGMNHSSGTWNLYRVNLESGDNSQIGNQMKYAFILPNAVSPDGT